MAVEKQVFGKGSNGEEIFLYTLKNTKGMEAAVSNLGAALVKLLVPDKTGKTDDVVLGFDTPEEYGKNPSFFGVVIGPSANRIGGASFEIDGVTYGLDDNDGGNNLHSHREKGYHKRIWQEKEMTDNSVTFYLEDEDGSMGFPGSKKIQVTYGLDEENGLSLHYHGTSDAKTIINLTNHTYFNLEGHGSGSITEHELWLDAEKYTPAVKSIPTGELARVAGTPMDFTSPKTIARDIETAFEQLADAGGYDHNWVINGWNGSLRHFATVRAPKSGRVMKAYTTLPGVQLYVGNFIDPQIGKGGVSYGKRGGLCLETQYFPDAVHHTEFPGCIFGGEEGREYDSVTVYRFE